MKRSFLWFAPLTLMFAASCSSSDDSITVEKDVYDDGLEQKIVLGTGSPATRGTGSIGDTIKGSGNAWHEEALYVYAILKDSAMTLNNMLDGIKGVKAMAPNGAASGNIKWNDGTQVKYFPLYGTYDFYAYHIDDARTTTSPAIVYSKDSITIPYKINGTQDIMAAKSQLTTENKIAFVKALIKNDKLSGKAADGSVPANAHRAYIDENTGYLVKGAATYADDSTKIYAEYAKAHSSYSARRGVQPTLKFNHLLSRLKFYIIAGEAQAAAGFADYTAPGYSSVTKRSGVFVDSIKVASYTKGNLVIKRDDYRVDPDTTIAIDTLRLMQRSAGYNYGDNLETLTPTIPEKVYSAANYKADATPIGESMLLVPSKDYKVKVHTTQLINLYGSPIPGTNGLQNHYDMTIDLPGGKVFEPGYSYNVYIIVYGSRPIEIKAELTGWISGGDIPLDPEFI